MREFDLIVLGGGTGNIVASAAADAGQEVALVERGPLGGTCLNRGCNPSKKLVHRADVVETIRDARSFGIDVSLDDIPYERFIEEVSETVAQVAEAKAATARNHDQVTFFQCEGRFVDEHTVAVDRARGVGHIASDRIVLAGGSRPLVPDSIDGTDEVAFLTSDDALQLERCPDRLVIVGGGYVAVELGHFFAQMGADVAIVGSGDVLVDREDRDAAERLTEAYRGSHELHLGYRATELEGSARLSEGDESGAADGTTVVHAAPASDSDTTGQTDAELTIEGDEVLLATGRTPNSDLWDVDAAGIKTDDAGFVETNDCLETSVDGIWAIGDIAGNYLFKHAADKEAEYAVANAVHGRDEPVSYPGMAHAVFGSPQLASLGLPEREVPPDRDYGVGTCEYDETALGSAMATDVGFAKAIVADDDEVLGVHMVGPEASTLIHEVSTAVAAGADATDIAETIHVHPALSEVVQAAFRDVRPVAPTGF